MAGWPSSVCWTTPSRFRCSCSSTPQLGLALRKRTATEIVLLVRTTTSNLIAVGRSLLAPDEPEVCGPPRSNATACTANEPRCRCPGCCSARPLLDNLGQARSPAGQCRFHERAATSPPSSGADDAAALGPPAQLAGAATSGLRRRRTRRLHADADPPLKPYVASLSRRSTGSAAPCPSLKKCPLEDTEGTAGALSAALICITLPFRR